MEIQLYHKIGLKVMKVKLMFKLNLYYLYN